MQSEIEIRPILNGWLVVVGCQTLAYTDKETMLRDLREWLDKPEETEKRILESAVNYKRLMGDRLIGLMDGATARVRAFGEAANGGATP